MRISSSSSARKLICGQVEGREEPGKGRGVLWEVKSIYNAGYTEDEAVQRFIPVLFADGQPSWIPLPLRGLTHYEVDIPEGYEDLYRHLTNPVARFQYSVS